MRALLSVTAGGPERLTFTDLPSPKPAAGEIAMKVSACGINYFDWLIIQDLYQLRPPRPFAPGAEWSGEVVAVGDGVEGFAIGDRMLGGASFGGLAEEIALPASAARKLPAGMSFIEGAGWQTTFGTAYYSLSERGGLKAGETLLVLGAAGGMGAAAVQLGKAMGARVLGVVSSEAKAVFAGTQGADDVLVVPPEETSSRANNERMKQLCGAHGADIILDPVGGPLAEAALRAIAWSGRFLIVGFAAGVPSIPLNLPLLKHCEIIGCRWGAFSRAQPKDAARILDELGRLQESAKLKPAITETYPFDRAREAISVLGERRAMGKIVVVMD